MKKEINLNFEPPALGWLLIVSVLFIPFHLMLNSLGGWHAPWWTALIPFVLWVVGVALITAYAIQQAKRANQRWSLGVKIWRFERHWGWKDDGT